jgi:hypothetical protein
LNFFQPGRGRSIVSMSIDIGLQLGRKVPTFEVLLQQTWVLSTEIDMAVLGKATIYYCRISFNSAGMRHAPPVPR